MRSSKVCGALGSIGFAALLFGCGADEAPVHGEKQLKDIRYSANADGASMDVIAIGAFHPESPAQPITEEDRSDFGDIRCSGPVPRMSISLGGLEVEAYDIQILSSAVKLALPVTGEPLPIYPLELKTRDYTDGTKLVVKDQGEVLATFDALSDPAWGVKTDAIDKTVVEKQYIPWCLSAKIEYPDVLPLYEQLEQRRSVDIQFINAKGDVLMLGQLPIDGLADARQSVLEEFSESQ